MNREAAALGVPAASIYAGTWAAIDEQLVAEGRLKKIASLEDIESLVVQKKTSTAPRANKQRVLRSPSSSSMKPELAKTGLTAQAVRAPARAPRWVVPLVKVLLVSSDIILTTLRLPSRFTSVTTNPFFFARLKARSPGQANSRLTHSFAAGDSDPPAVAPLQRFVSLARRILIC